MTKQLRLVGTVNLDDEPPVLLCTYDRRKTGAAIADLERKLLDLIDGSFRPAHRGKPGPNTCPLMSLKEVLALWRCHRVTVLRLIKRGLLHPIHEIEPMYFERSEVLKVGNRRIAVYPHLTISRRPRS